MIVRQGIAPALAGVALGAVMSRALARFLESQLFGVSATNALTIGWVALLLGAVALAACYLPAARASRVDPAVTLRSE